MMKTLLLTAALLMALAPATLAEDAPNAEVLSAEISTVAALDSPAETADQVVTEDVLDSDGLPLSAVEIATEEASAGYECPPFTTYCSQNFQCDAGCGGSGGFCQFGCCYCSF